MATRKKTKTVPCPEQMKKLILETHEPIVLKNALSWSLLSWTSEDWMEKLGNEKLDVRIGSKQCTKVGRPSVAQFNCVTENI